MEDDATQNGVSEKQEQSKEQERHPVNPRDEIIEAIAERAEKERRDALGLTDEAKPGEAETPDEKKEEPKGEEEKPPGPSDEKVKIVVDGREQEVPVSQLIETGKRALQKDLAADRRLEEASRLLREARERYERAAASQQAAETPPKPDANAKPDEEDSEKISKLVRAIQYGDEQEAAWAIREITRAAQAGAANQKPISHEDIRSAVDQRIKQNTILQRFEAEFPDLVGDPRLSFMAVQEVDRLLHSGEYRNDWTLYHKAGENVREWIGNIGGKKPEEKVGDDLEKRREQKRQLDTVKSAGAKAGGSGENEPKPQTPSEIVEEMRKARGQAV